VELQSLGQADFERILTEPSNALTVQQKALLEGEGLAVTFEETQVSFGGSQEPPKLGLRCFPVRGSTGILERPPPFPMSA